MVNPSAKLSPAYKPSQPSYPTIAKVSKAVLPTPSLDMRLRSTKPHTHNVDQTPSQFLGSMAPQDMMMHSSS